MRRIVTSSTPNPSSPHSPSSFNYHFGSSLEQALLSKSPIAATSTPSARFPSPTSSPGGSQPPTPKEQEMTTIAFSQYSPRNATLLSSNRGMKTPVHSSRSTSPTTNVFSSSRRPSNAEGGRQRSSSVGSNAGGGAAELFTALDEILSNEMMMMVEDINGPMMVTRTDGGNTSGNNQDQQQQQGENSSKSKPIHHPPSYHMHPERKAIIISVLATPFETRSRDDRKLLQKMTKHIDYFQRPEVKPHHLALCSVLQHLRIEANECLYAQGSVGKTFFIILEGTVQVKVRTSDEEDNEKSDNMRTVATLYSGDCFGELAILGDGLRTASVFSITPCDFIVIREEEYRVTMSKSREISAFLVCEKPPAKRTEADLEQIFELIKDLSFCDSLSLSLRKEICRVISHQRYRDGSIVYSKGTKADGFYIVKGGGAEIFSSFPGISSSLVKVMTLKRGDTFGEVGLVTDGVREATVRAREELHVFVVSSSDFDTLLKEKYSFELREKVQGLCNLFPSGYEINYLTIKQLSLLTTLKSFDHGKVVFAEEQPLTHISYVTRGECRIVVNGEFHSAKREKNTPRGLVKHIKPLEFAAACAGEMVGELYLWSGCKTWPVTIVAASDVMILMIRLDHFSDRFFPRCLTNFRRNARAKATSHERQLQTVLELQKKIGLELIKKIELPPLLPIVDEWAAMPPLEAIAAGGGGDKSCCNNNNPSSSDGNNSDANGDGKKPPLNVSTTSGNASRSKVGKAASLVVGRISARLDFKENAGVVVAKKNGKGIEKVDEMKPVLNSPRSFFPPSRPSPRQLQLQSEFLLLSPVSAKEEPPSLLPNTSPPKSSSIPPSAEMASFLWRNSRFILPARPTTAPAIPSTRILSQQHLTPPPPLPPPSAASHRISPRAQISHMKIAASSPSPSSSSSPPLTPSVQFKSSSRKKIPITPPYAQVSFASPSPSSRAEVKNSERRIHFHHEDDDGTDFTTELDNYRREAQLQNMSPLQLLLLKREQRRPKTTAH